MTGHFIICMQSCVKTYSGIVIAIIFCCSLYSVDEMIACVMTCLCVVSGHML